MMTTTAELIFNIWSYWNCNKCLSSRNYWTGVTKSIIVL